MLIQEAEMKPSENLFCSAVPQEPLDKRTRRCLGAAGRLTRRWLSWSLSPPRSSSGCGLLSRSADPPGCCGQGFSEGFPLSCTHNEQAQVRG